MRLVLLLSFISIYANAQVTATTSLEPVDWVSTLMGTDSNGDFSNGNTYPGITMPWGMNCWIPQTGRMGDGWAYTYDAERIRGFKQTHQPSPWMNDYGQFSIMPMTEKVMLHEDERASWFSHKSETATPYYYSVYLADHNVTTEITPTERAAMFRFTFPKTDKAYVIIDGFDGGSYIKVIENQQKVIGYTRKNSGGTAGDLKNYFVIRFDKPFTVSHTWREHVLQDTLSELLSNHTGAVIGFSTKKGGYVHARVASSFISFEQAEINLGELGTDSFEIIKQKGKDIWNKTLSRVSVEGGTAEQMQTFYSCLYRTLLFPRKFYEINSAGKTVHYSPYNGKVEPGYLYTDTGFWDTFRALFPFLNLMYPSVNAQIQEGLVNTYKEGGWLPEWASPGYRDIMVGSNSASIVADAYVKGIRGHDINTLYQAVLKNAENEGPVTAVGRKGVSFYNTLGYVPYDVGINENAARTLEYAYDDFAIYQLAKSLNRPKKEINLFAKRCQNYRNLFDKQTGLMRGKNKDGSFQTPFNPFKWGDAFTEGNSWHYTWSVFHDVQGLIDLMGGQKHFAMKLDSVFTLPPVFDDSYYGGVIHEIREMQVANMGQYAHGNQPIQHMIYLYNYAGQPWKAQYWLRETMNRMYHSSPDGFCGDEDNGQTSAWYVFSALGFYPVCPATDQYVIGTPLFTKTTLQLENGKQIIINAPNNNIATPFIKQLNVNGVEYNKNWFSHTTLMKGAVLDFIMAGEPKKIRGTENESLPYSFSKDEKNIR